MSDEMRVRHLGNDRFAIDVRGHTLTVDQPVPDGGDDSAPTPTELFIAALASCVVFYARRFLARHDVDPTGLEVAAEYTIGPRPVRVTDISVRLTPPPTLAPARRDAFLAVASRCTVHNTLDAPPAVTISLTTDEQR